jgi:chromosome condensin MukBEF ATPase and DNA-binding subunit MukB
MTQSLRDIFLQLNRKDMTQSLRDIFLQLNRKDMTQSLRDIFLQLVEDMARTYCSSHGIRRSVNR